MITLTGLVLLLISPAVGSFLGVLVDRLPRGEDVVRQPSACRGCGQKIPARDLVPLLSYLLLRGRARCCGAKIPPLLPLLEAGAFLVALLMLLLAQSDLHMLFGTLYLWLLLALLASDATVMRLPDPLTAALLLVGLALAWEDPYRSLPAALLAALGAAAVFWGIRIAYFFLRGREGLGLGDVKLIGGIAAGLGAAQTPLAVLVAALLALGFAAAQALWRQTPPSATTALPFGSFLCLGAALVWCISL
ncbi:prepilin peptidase [Neptunicoccus cionae]|uniref:Prepilin leader peptidase/N-methyltransferase n=1 Tax=Neptunicoccus cionae TaxID=2035344 RepID=A0A916R400_9RHOB|nr:prepilin peptidase [Amylibacter cionae]GGA29462.1 type 4 prepilin-like proteins leader peptide-processing enzyme [Amylibacter cionae]